MPDKATELREHYGQLLSQIETARRNTNGFVPKQDISPESRFMLNQLRAVVKAVQDLNETFGPVLYGFPEDQR